MVYYRVSNATVSIANVENAHHSTRLLAQTTLRNTMGTRHLHEILSERVSISGSMQVSKKKTEKKLKKTEKNLKKNIQKTTTHIYTENYFMYFYFEESLFFLAIAVAFSFLFVFHLLAFLSTPPPTFIHSCN